jgi:hypothetical protein
MKSANCFSLPEAFIASVTAFLQAYPRKTLRAAITSFQNIVSKNPAISFLCKNNANFIF